MILGALMKERECGMALVASSKHVLHVTSYMAR